MSDISVIQKKTGPNFNSWYEQMTDIMKNHGPDVCQSMDCVMGYQITDLQGA